ncbi:hypothetical protein CAEBREN_32040 [Caenorhabditis brenneri]|uniref:PAN-3 domain-containing protein n=1 Tax=Caenorhabditis brenneri TaxID=135651 RepID=G0NAB9_CAEBE|nr:hypothetical protein CAEBREN_32040 [Caenorhabditis brenneri]
MIVIPGAVVYPDGVVPVSRGEWAQCLEECRTTWNCAISSQTITGCFLFFLNQVTSIDLSNTSTAVAFKMSLPNECPLKTDNPPLFGKSTSEVIATNGTSYFKTQVVGSTESQLTLNFTSFECLKDFPENPVLRGNDPIRYDYPLAYKFLPGEEFFMKGKIAPTFNKRFTISFLGPSDTYPLFIKVINGLADSPYSPEKGNHQIEISTWKETFAANPISIKTYPNPYNNSDAFEIRIKSSDTQVFVYLNGTTTLTFDIEPSLPLNSTISFVINYSGTGGERVDDYYVGWTGECSWVPMT